MISFPPSRAERQCAIRELKEQSVIWATERGGYTKKTALVNWKELLKSGVLEERISERVSQTRRFQGEVKVALKDLLAKVQNSRP